MDILILYVIDFFVFYVFGFSYCLCYWMFDFYAIFYVEISIFYIIEMFILMFGRGYTC